ncbi:MAG: STAS domain-containing protein [Leptospiraceae bacterium]|nr:STAS domain-containing protein [Leptospiraceae bacterium]MCP5495789.1 STAS domain-containing protein [Leptospiraceae bacterium]
MEVITKENIQILKLTGSVLQSEAEKFETFFKNSIEKKNTNIVVDLTEANHICSSILGQLVFYKNSVKSTSGDIKLVIVDEDLLELFEITLLNKVFHIYNNLEYAIRTYQ